MRENIQYHLNRTAFREDSELLVMCEYLCCKNVHDSLRHCAKDDDKQPDRCFSSLISCAAAAFLRGFCRVT